MEFFKCLAFRLTNFDMLFLVMGWMLLKRGMGNEVYDVH